MSKSRAPKDDRQQAFAFFLSGDAQKAEVKHPKAGEFDRAVRDQVAQTLEDTARRDVAPQSRDQVAAAMSTLLGRRISKTQLDQWAAPSQDDRRLPVDALWALGRVTGDWRVLHCLVDASGFRALTPEEAVCAEFGALFAVKRHIDSRARELTGDMDGLVAGLIGKMRAQAQ